MLTRLRMSAVGVPFPVKTRKEAVRNESTI